MLRLLCPLFAALLFAGCAKDESIRIPVEITSVPDACEVHYRMKELAHAQRIPEKREWKYLGRTPFRGKAKLPKEFLDAPDNAVEIRVRKKDYRTVTHEVTQPDVDLTHGISFQAALRSKLLPEKE